MENILETFKTKKESLMSKKTLITLMLIAVVSFIFMACQSQHFTGAKVYIQQSNWDKAIEQLKIETQTNPTNAEAWWLLAYSYAKKRMYPEMNKALEEMVKVDPTRKEKADNLRHNEWVPFYNSAVNAMRKRNFQAALEKINKAIEIYKEKPGNWANLGIIYINLDSLDKAKENFYKALDYIGDIKTKNDTLLAVTCYKNLGAIYINKDSVEKALENYQKVVEITPNDALAWSSIGTCYDKLKQNEKAKEAYMKATELEPENKDLWYNIGVSCYQIKNYTCAEESFAKVCQLDPKDTDALNNLAIVYIQLKKWEDAVNTLKKLIELEPDNPEYWNNLGIAYVNLGNKKEGKKAFDKANELEKNKNK